MTMKWLEVFDFDTYFSVHQVEVVEETEKSVKLKSGSWERKVTSYRRYFSSTKDMIDYLYPEVEKYLARREDDIRKLQGLKQAMDDWKEEQNAQHTT